MKEFSQLRLQAILKILGNVKSSGNWTYRTADQIRTAKKNGILTLAHTESHSGYHVDSILYKAYPWNDKESHRAYDGCHVFELVDSTRENMRDTPKGCEGQQYLVYTVYEGNNFSGRREEPRVTYYLTGDWTKLEDMVQTLEAHFKHHCLQEYDKEMDRLRREAAEAMGNAMIEAVFNEIPV